MSDDLASFVRAAKAQGMSDEFCVALLKENGWPESTVYRAFTHYYAQELKQPVPVRARGAAGARDAFYYLLNFITLGFWTVALGQIFYMLIAYKFPDPVSSRYAYEPPSLRDEIAWQVATVIVAFPIFLFVHNLITRELARRPELYESGIRRWLTYIALVIAAIVVIGDGVWFIGALIRGELTVRFVLDSLVLLVLGGGVFAYYLITMDPRSTNE